MLRFIGRISRSPSAHALLIFFLLSLLLCAPALFAPGAKLIGNADSPGAHGEIFHQQDFIDNLTGGFLSQPFKARGIAHPHGQDLREFMGVSLHLYFYTPWMWLQSSTARYNILLLLTLTLNGFCAYLLGRALARQQLPALLCGVLFLISPYALLKLEMGFPQKVILWWIPLFLLSLIRFLNRPNVRDALSAGLFWALMLLTYAPYGWYAVWAGLVLVGVGAATNRSQLPAMLRTGWSAVIPAMAALLLYFSVAGSAIHDATADALPWAVMEAPRGGIDPLHPLRCFPYTDFMPMVRHLPIGISLIGICAAVVALVRRRRHALALSIVALLFMLIAVGPYLHTKGEVLAGLKLPYYFLACHLPGGSRLGFPLRALPFVDIALAALLASATAELHWRKRHLLTMALLMLVLLVVERRALSPEIFPPRATSAELSPAAQWLVKHRGTALHLPFTPDDSDCRRYIYLSARTHTQMLNPYLDGPPGFPAPPDDMVIPGELQLYLERLFRAGCDYLVLHPPVIAALKNQVTAPAEQPPHQPLTTDAIARIRRRCGPPAIADDELVIFRIPPPAALRIGAPAISQRQTEYLRDAESSAFVRPRQVRVHHLLIAAPSSGVMAGRDAAREKATAILQRIQRDRDATFAIAEALNHENPQQHWGDIGFISRGTFPQPIDDAIFALNLGESCMVEQPDGFHIFLLMATRPPLDGVETDIAVAAKADALTRRTRLQTARLRADVSHDMVLIPGGTFFFGSTEEEIARAAEMARSFVGRITRVDPLWFEDERGYEVTVSPFLIDRYEVTNAEYEKFLAATKHPPPPGWNPVDATSAALPVVKVNWHDANAYARWAGKRLPTEQEWEWAARGPMRLWFPWGDQWPDGSLANYADASSQLPWCDLQHNDMHPGLAPIGSYPAGATPEGIFDMAGNAREWTSSEHEGIVDPEDGHIWEAGQVRRDIPDLAALPSQPMFAVRGGGFENAADDMRSPDARILPPTARHRTQGFRCVMDMP